MKVKISIAYLGYDKKACDLLIFSYTVAKNDILKQVIKEALYFKKYF